MRLLVEAPAFEAPDEQRSLVTGHEVLGYFADRYEFEVIGSVIPVTSVSWKASPPIRWADTWPVIHTIGDESIIAVEIPVTRFVAPGPEVAIITPTFPVAAMAAIFPSVTTMS